MDLLKLFKEEVSKNRSALLGKSFFEAWHFLNLNPDLKEKEEVIPCRNWFEEIFNFSFLEVLVKKNTSNEVRVHEHVDLNKEDLQISAENMALSLKKNWNLSSPFLSAKITLNMRPYRITLIHPSITADQQVKIYLRKHMAKSIALENYHAFELLKKLLKNEKSILISGGTGSGKTTLLQAFLQESPKHEHIVILEDTHELNLERKNTTHLLSNSENSLVDYCSYSMRVSPDRLVLGELRGAEVLPLVLSLNTGHGGLMTTIHADSAILALKRLETLLGFYSSEGKNHFELICSGIDIVIHMHDKNILEIIDIRGQDDGKVLYEYLFKSALKQACAESLKPHLAHHQKQENFG